MPRVTGVCYKLTVSNNTGHRADDEERAFLETYDPTAFPPVSLTVDTVLFTIRAGTLQVLLVKRGSHPFRGHWALPGGFVRPDEDPDSAARRELQEESGLDVRPAHLEQLATYGAPGRDPRMRVVTVAYVGMMPDLPSPAAGTDATDAHFFPVQDLDLASGAETQDGPALAFDHYRIIADGLERVRAKLEYTPLATRFADERFTLADLRRIYEAVWDIDLHPANFRRKVLSTPGFVRAIGAQGKPSQPGGRSADLYRAGNAELLHPAMLRPDTAHRIRPRKR